MATPMDPPIDPRTMSVEGFLAAIRCVPWFRHLGEPNGRDVRVARIRRWEEWPGPESPRVESYGVRSQEWHDRMIELAGTREWEVRGLFERIGREVVEHAGRAVAFDLGEDAWHGPTAAVGDAAWVSGVVGCHLLLGCEIPSEVLDRWAWFAEGHWPCGYAYEPDEGEDVALLVL